MNQKQVGLFAILAVFTLSLTASFAGVADALTSPALETIKIHDPSTRAERDYMVNGDVTTFTAVFAVVKPANIDVRNVEILVSSDTESVKGKLLGNYENNRRIISVMIDAVDPASINAKIIGFEI
ncbi:MAG TPA: hypothetical protein VLC72_01975 [Nitrosopumilaceae archaeon]|nr:hypothetical protein [Nitrosopumilaceae archaeon]